MTASQGVPRQGAVVAATAGDKNSLAHCAVLGDRAVAAGAVSKPGAR